MRGPGSSYIARSETGEGFDVFDASGRQIAHHLNENEARLLAAKMDGNIDADEYEEPWEAHFTSLGDEIFFGDGYWLVGPAYLDGDNSDPVKQAKCEADARLISAAREMLAALRLHKEYEALPVDRGGAGGPKGLAHAKWIRARDAAIAKAEGKP